MMNNERKKEKGWKRGLFIVAGNNQDVPVVVVVDDIEPEVVERIAAQKIAVVLEVVEHTAAQAVVHTAWIVVGKFDPLAVELQEQELVV